MKSLSSPLLGTLMLSVAMHAPPILDSLSSLGELRHFAKDATDAIHDRLWTDYDVELEQPKVAPKPEEKKEDEKPEPEPVHLVVPKAPTAPKSDAKPDERPPAAAEAGKTLTAPDDGKPVDFTDFTLTQGEGDRFAGGVTAKDGRSKDKVDDASARGGVDPGGTGKAPPPPPPPPDEPDRSRPAKALRSHWSCPFPPEADADDVNSARVAVVVMIRADGTASSVRITADPGHGFGRAARMCALGERYAPALDRKGEPTDGQFVTTITFTR